MFVIYPLVCLCCDSSALLLARQTGAHEKQLMLSCLWCFEFETAPQTNRLEFRWSRSICDEDHNVLADWFLLIGFGLCLPIFVCTEHCGRLVSTLASCFGGFGFIRRNAPAPHVLTEVFRTLSATGHIDTGFSWFPCVYKQMLRWFATFQVATTCFSCSPPDLNLLVTDFIFCIHVK